MDADPDKNLWMQGSMRKAGIRPGLIRKELAADGNF